MCLEVHRTVLAVFSAPVHKHAVTTEVASKLLTFGQGREQIRLNLTDVPGFDDPNLPNTEIVRLLLNDFQKPGNQNVHALVLVEKWHQERTTESAIKSLKLLQQEFGDEMFDCLVMILTHFPYPEMNCAIAAKEAADNMVEQRKSMWQRSITDHFPASGRRWQGTLFCLDCQAAMLPNYSEPAKNARGAGIRASEEITQQRCREFSLKQIEIMKLQFAFRSRDNCCMQVKQKAYW